MNPEGRGGSDTSENGIVTVELRFDSMRQFQAEFSPNLSRDGVFIPHASPFPASTVVRFIVKLPDDFRLLEGVGVVLWTREEEPGSGQPAGMALHFASLGPRHQELIDSLVETMVAEGGQPFELALAGDFDELAAPDPLAGRSVPPERSSPPAPRERPPKDETPLLKVRGEEDDHPERRASAVALPGAVMPAPAEVGRGGGAPPPPAVADATTEEPRRDDPATVAEPRDAPGGPGGDPSVGPPAGGPEPEPTWDVPTSTGFDQGELEAIAEPELRRPPHRPATRPLADLDSRRGDGDQPSGSSDEVTSAQLVAEVIADEASRSLERAEDEESSAVPEEFDEAVDTFADSLRRLDQAPSTHRVGSMPEVTIVPRDDDEAEAPTRRRVPWGALAAVAVVLALAAVGYFAREPLARLLVPESQPAEADSDGGATDAQGVGSPAATPTPAGAVTGATATVPAAEPTAAVGPAATPTRAELLAEPTAVRPEPTATPAPRPAASGPAGRVEDIRWTTGAGRTVVTILTDGSMSENRVRVGTMSDPPRVLVRLLRIDRFRPFELPVGTTELDRIRLGHHPEQRPPSLHVVLDLSGPEVKLLSTDVVGAEVRLTLAR